MAFDFSKMKGKKVEGDKLSALKGALGAISNDASKKIAGNLQKVTVASNDKKGLEMGLDKAKQMVSKPKENDMGDFEQKDNTETPEGKIEEICVMTESMSQDEIQQLISKLQEKVAMA
jgi:hypothetical protein